jgi:hypothetical protein
VRSAKAVFDAADDAVRVMPIPFKVDDGIDDVLDDLGAGQHAGLGDVADDDHGDAAGFGQADQVHAAIAQLRHRPRRGGQSGLVNHLHRIDDHHIRMHLIDLMGNPLNIGFSEHQKIFRIGSQPSGSHGDLLSRFFAGDVENFSAGRRQPICHLQQQSRFADPRLPADEHGRSADNSAAEHSIEFPDAAGPPRDLRCIDSAHGLRLTGPQRIGLAIIHRRRRVFLERIPCAAIGAFSQPLGMNAAAGVAEELGTGLGHGWIV